MAPRLQASKLSGWLRLAFAPATVRRGLTYAVVVGAILIGINHGDAILHDQVSRGRLLRMGLTVIVPYLVSTLSSVAAIRGQAGPERKQRKTEGRRISEEH